MIKALLKDKADQIRDNVHAARAEDYKMILMFPDYRKYVENTTIWQFQNLNLAVADLLDPPKGSK